MPGAIFLIAAAAASGATSSLPDVSVTANVHAREVRIEQQGDARLRIWAEPSAGDKVEVKRNLPKGERRYRNLDITLDAEARLADPTSPAARTRPPTGK